MDGPTKSCTSYVLDFGSAAKTTLFASDVETVADALFQQATNPEGSSMKTYTTLMFCACIAMGGATLAADGRSAPHPTYTEDVAAIQQLLARYAHALDS